MFLWNKKAWNKNKIKSNENKIPVILNICYKSYTYIQYIIVKKNKENKKLK